MAGDAHNNRWGSHNNVWGRKKTSSKNNNSNTHYEPSRLFNTLAAGALIFLAGALGITMVGNVISGIGSVKDAKDKVEQAQQIVQNVQSSTSNTSSPVQSGTALIDEVAYELMDIDISPEDIADILQLIADKYADAKSNSTLVFDYKDCDTAEKYHNTVLSHLDSKHNCFVIVNTDQLEDTSDAINNYIANVVEAEMNLKGLSGFDNVLTSGRRDIPETNNYAIIVRYVANES